MSAGRGPSKVWFNWPLVAGLAFNFAAVGVAGWALLGLRRRV